MSSLRNISCFLPPYSYSSVALRAISADPSDKDDDLLPAVSTIPTSWYKKQRLKSGMRDIARKGYIGPFFSSCGRWKRLNFYFVEKEDGISSHLVYVID